MLEMKYKIFGQHLKITLYLKEENAKLDFPQFCQNIDPH